MRTKVYAVDWANTDDALAVFDGKTITYEMPEALPGTIIVAENIPLKYARPYFDAGGRIFRCKTQETTKRRKAEELEKTHENDARIIYDLYRKTPEIFREWKFDRFFAELGDLYSAFKEVQHSRVATGNRVYANSNQRIKDIYAALEAGEKSILAEMEAILATMPIYTEYLTNIKGIGPAVSAGLLACVGDVGRFATISKANAYFGLHVVDGKAPRKQKGQVANWHQRGRSLLIGVIGDMFIKQRTPVYRAIYDAEKERQLPNFDTPGQAHNRAKRKAVKAFFKHFLKAYRELGPGDKILPDRTLATVVKPRKKARKKAVAVAEAEAVAV